MENTSLTGDQKVANSSNSTVATQEQQFNCCHTTITMFGDCQLIQFNICPIVNWQLLPHNNNKFVICNSQRLMLFALKRGVERT